MIPQYPTKNLPRRPPFLLLAADYFNITSIEINYIFAIVTFTKHLSAILFLNLLLEIIDFAANINLLSSSTGWVEWVEWCGSGVKRQSCPSHIFPATCEHQPIASAASSSSNCVQPNLVLIKTQECISIRDPFGG